MAFECQLILLDSFRFILQVEKAMGFHEVGFSKILIGSQGKIAGFNGFLKFLPVKMRFGQSGPIGRVVRIFIYQFVIVIDCLLVVIATAVTSAIAARKSSSSLYSSMPSVSHDNAFSGIPCPYRGKTHQEWCLAIPCLQ